MVDVTMPDGVTVAFPDDMPRDQIRGLIERKFPDAQRRALADTGVKPYQNVGEVALTTIQNIPAGLSRGKAGAAEGVLETLRDQLDPTVQYGSTATTFTPGAPVEDYLNQPAGAIVPYETPVTQFMPEDMRRDAAKGLAMQVLDQRLRSQRETKKLAENPVDARPGSWEQIVGGGIGSTVEMIAPMTVSALVRNPAPLMAYFGTRSFGEGYLTGQETGVGHDQALLGAALYAAAEGATEALAGKVLLDGGKTLLSSVLRGAGIEGVTEGATEALQVLVDSGVLGVDMTLEEALERVKVAGLTGSVAGGAIAPLTHTMRPKPDEPPPPPEEPEPEPEAPIEESVAPPVQTLLALPPPRETSDVRPIMDFRPPDLPGRPAEPAPVPTEDDLVEQARIALRASRQEETAALLKTARETIQPLGTFTPQQLMASFGRDGQLHPGTMNADGTISSPGVERDAALAAARGKPPLQRINEWRIRTGRDLDAPITIEDMARAGVPQSQIDALIETRRPFTEGQILKADDVLAAAEARNIVTDDQNFRELAFRSTGSRNVQRMTQAQLRALKSVVDAMPVNDTRVTVPIAEAQPFTEADYAKAVEGVRKAGRYTQKAIKDAVGSTDAKRANAIRDAMVRRGQLVKRAENDYRLYDVLGEERQSTPADLPPGAIREHTVRRLPVSGVRVRQNGKSVGTFGSAAAAREKVSQLRAAETGKSKPSEIVIEPAADTAWGVLENRYDERGEFLGQAVVDTARDETAAQKLAETLNSSGQPAAAAEPAAPSRRPPPPAALAGRLPEIVQRLNAQAKQRNMPLLGTRVKIVGNIDSPAGHVEGMYWNKLISIAAGRLDPNMTTDEVVEVLGSVMDHELIHALRAAGVLDPNTDAWRTLWRYVRKAKRPDTSETYLEYAKRLYTGMPGYGTLDIEEEAIADAFRHWAANRRNVVGKPAAVFRQLVEWFRALFRAVPADLFRGIETGDMVAAALTPPGSNTPRARSTRRMAEAKLGAAAAEAQMAADPAQRAQAENAVRVKSREFLRARAQARDDRYGRSGPKTVLGTTPSRSYAAGELMDRGAVAAIVDRYKAASGQPDATGLNTLLPDPVRYEQDVARAQQRATHQPDSPAVQKAYRALEVETLRMFDAMGKPEIVPWREDGPPYASPAEMLEDVLNGQVKMRLSADMFGEGADNAGHPMYQPAGFKARDGSTVLLNDVFRVVHDVFGYGQIGLRDDAQGAYNAYHEHARLYSPQARRALATETLAQQAWHGFGPHLERRDGTVPRETDIDWLPADQKEFAEQKAFVLDDEMLGTDPGWQLAAEAGTAESPRFSLAPPTDSPAFKRWFGDSKVVESNQPLVVYHFGGFDENEAVPNGPMHFGTRQAAEQRAHGKRVDDAAMAVTAYQNDDGAWHWDDGSGLTSEELDLPGFSSEDIAILKGRAEVVGQFENVDDDPTEGGVFTAAYLRIVNPKYMPDQGSDWTQAIAQARAEGHDGIIYVNQFEDKRSRSYLVFEPTQIKSVYNRGTFDPNDPRIRYSLTAEHLPGGRLYGNTKRSPGGAMSEPEVASPAFTVNQPADRFFGGEIADRQLQMARDGDRGATMLYLTPDDFLALTDGEMNPEQAAYDALLDAGYKFNTLPSIVVEGYAGNVRVTNSDGAYAVRSLARQPGFDKLPVVIYPNRGVSLGHVTALERGDATVLWPHEGRAENFPDERENGGPRYSLTAPFGSRVPPAPPPSAFNIVHQRTEGFIGRALHGLGRSKRAVIPTPKGLVSIFEVREKLQDKMLSVKEMIESIRVQDGRVDDLNDTYMLEQLYHGKVFDQTEHRKETLFDPLLEALKAEKGVSPKDLEDYLYARHAPERNEYLRARGSPEPYPSGMSDREASDLMDKLALAGKLPALERLAALADRITADTTRTRVEAGLISQQAADSSPYQFYVPLRGFDAEVLDPDLDTPNEVRARSGKGFSTGGREDRATTGRGRKAGDLLGHLFLQNIESVIRAEKNEVAMSFARLVQENKDLGYGRILKSAPTRRVVGANGMIHEAGDPFYRQRPDIVIAKRDGQEIIVEAADPRVARAIKSDYVSSSNMLVNVLGALNRWLAMVNTSLNPEFLISNLARDMQTAGILSNQYDIKGFGGKIIGNAPKAMGGIREALRAGTTNGQWAKFFRQLQEDGGTTEFLGIHDLETQLKSIRGAIGATGLRATARKTLEQMKRVGKFIDDYNKVAENAFRLSAYVAAIDAGATRPQAAFLAKNLTVNFNKGGEWKTAMNAAYLFYNASLQGTMVLLNGLRSKKVRRIAGAVVLAGIVQDLINQAISGDDDENGVKDYDDIPDYVLRTNFVVMDPLGILKSFGIDRGYISIPMPYGFNAFYNAGRNMGAVLGGKPVGEAASDIAVTALDSFNPLGGAQDFVNFVAPTVADPVVDWLANRDFSGQMIVPERPTFGVPVPESQKYWSTTGEIPVEIARQLNSLTGGNVVRSGGIDVSPELLQYTFDFFTGAAGKFAARTTDFALNKGPAMLMGDFEDVTIGDIPFARRVIGSVGSRQTAERYYTIADEVAVVAEELKVFMEDGDGAAVRQVLQRSPLDARMVEPFSDANDMLSDLRKQLREVREHPSLPATRKRELERRIKERMDQVMTQMVRAYMQARGRMLN